MQKNESKRDELASNHADVSNQTALKPSRNMFSVWRLASKELRETLRDRRTIITLVLMPLLVYPILSLVFRTFLLSNADAFKKGEPIQFSLVCAGVSGTDEANGVLGELVRMTLALESQTPENVDDAESTQPDFVPIEKQGWKVLDLTREELKQLVQEGKADAAIIVDTSQRKRGQLANFELIADHDYRSQLAVNYLRTRLDRFNDEVVQQRLQQARLPVNPALSISKTTWIGGQQNEKTRMAEAFSLASLIPLILVLMTITGAVYPAIDLTAGERERGTLEMLMAAPVPGTSILFGKFVAVLTVSVMTALLNLVGMAATVWAFQLDQFLPVGAAFNVGTLVKIFALLVLFAAFFSALLLAVTSNARSFKEAQAYLIPIILLSMGPGLMAMTPGLELSGVLSVTPMMNILLLCRDVIQQSVAPFPAVIAVVSTIGYALIAIFIAARSFGSSAMLYADSGSVAEMFQRPVESRSRVPVLAAVACAILLFPVNFVMIGVMGRLSTETASDLANRFSLMGVFTILSFVVIPWIIARHQRAWTIPAFGLNLARPSFWLIAVLLGISLWPLVMGMMIAMQSLYTMFAGADAGEAWYARLVQETSGIVGRVRQVQPTTVAIFLAIIPAACEEFFFRGMLLRSLLAARKGARGIWTAIVLSALIFGLFHVISNSVIALDRLLPTFLVGIVLGWLAWKSDSILPGVLLHAMHNAAVAFLGYYEPLLRKQSWFPADDSTLPLSWIVVAAVIAITAMFWLSRLSVSTKDEVSLMPD